MDIYELVKSRRTIRKFQRKEVSYDLLCKFIEYARFSPSAGNMQPVRYMIITGDKADQVFPHTRWAGHLKGAYTPSFDERPSAFILFLIPSGKSPLYDVGAIAQSIGLMAHHEGLGTCWMGAIDRGEIADICSVTDSYEIDTLLSIGYPAESPVAVDCEDDDTKYYLKDGTLNVPKLGVDEVIL